MDEFEKGMSTGLIVGIICTALVAFAIATDAERAKVRNGFLTWENKTYTVRLYDTLDKPEKETEVCDKP